MFYKASDISKNARPPVINVIIEAYVSLGFIDILRVFHNFV